MAIYIIFVLSIGCLLFLRVETYFEFISPEDGEIVNGDVKIDIAAKMVHISGLAGLPPLVQRKGLPLP